MIALARTTESHQLSRDLEIEWISYSDFASLAERRVFKGACMVHCAARAHRLGETSSDVKNKYWRDNVELTKSLVSHAVVGGVVKVIFLSTIKVLGEYTNQVAFSSSSPANPQDVYSQSKLAAERHLADVSRETGLSIITLRLPLVYGPGVKGNLQLLDRWLGRVCCLPLGSINCKRDMIGLGNLASVIHCCIATECSGYNTLLVSDGQPLSVTKLCTLIKKNRRYRTILVPVNTKLLVFLFSCVGRSSLSLRLFSNLEVDISATREFLGWSPPYTPENEIRRWLLNDGGSKL